MLLELIRFKEDKNSGALGVLKLDGSFFCYTLELDYKDNSRNISSIPVGKYNVVKHFSQHFKDVLMVDNVPDRSYIYFHAGNTIKDTKGCILVGNGAKDETVTGKIISDSRRAFNRLLAKAEQERSISLVVKEL